MPAKGCSIQTFVDRVRPLGRYMYLSPRGKLCSALFEKKPPFIQRCFGQNLFEVDNMES